MNLPKVARVLALSLGALGVLPGLAMADPWDHDRPGKHYGHHRHYHRDYGPRVVYVPSHVYAPPPPVMIAPPPPRVVYVQPAPPRYYEPAPSINFIFPLR